MTSIPKTTGAPPNGLSPKDTLPSLTSLLQACKADDAPILCGPFLGEVGFEVLYWIPWLAKIRADLKLDPTRIIPITRGGAGAWYGVPTAVELFAMRTPQDVRVQNRIAHAKTGKMKQHAVTPFDHAILADVAQTLKLDRYHVLHPHWMYQALEPFWMGQAGFEWLAKQSVYQLPLPTEAAPVGLPEKFVAVRFYARSTFPMSPQTTEFAKATIHKIAKDVPVVLLNTGLYVDDHLDFELTGPNISTLSDYAALTPENNLSVVSATLTKALGFVGTYGGLAQLALSLGKPSVSYYTEWSGTAIPHRHLAVDISLRANVPFLAHRIGDLPMLQSVLPTMLVAPPHSGLDATGSVPIDAPAELASNPV